MTSQRLTLIAQPFPPHAVFIIGAGHFGRRAALLLRRETPEIPVYAVDRREEQLSVLRHCGVQVIQGDGVRFAVENVRFMAPDHLLVPAVPLHLAFEWLKGDLGSRFAFRAAEIPREVLASVPQIWEAGDGSLLVSYADFLCPEDCPEPECCTVTGEKRDRPMHALLEGLRFADDRGVYIVRSRQLAPGLGGYRALDLTGMADVIASSGKSRWVLGTACRCHGVISAFEISGNPGGLYPGR